jgi:predicted nucleic acid-binding protein
VNPEEVPAGPLLIDTDVFSLLTFPRGRHAEFALLVAGHVLALSFATIGELRAGALNAGWGQERQRHLEERLRQYVAIPGTDAVATQFARIYARFLHQLDVNDMWTAACGLSQTSALPIVTANIRHFEPMAKEFGFSLVHPDQ